jgi:hypothetical protein
MFLKRTTPRSPNNINDNTVPNVHSPLKISSQMVLSNDFSQKNYQNNKYNEFYGPSKTEVNKNQLYNEEPLSQSFDVEAERRHQQRQRDYENPQNTDPETDYYYKQSKTSSDVNDYNNRYTYNYRRDFDYIDFNKLYPENQFGKNNNLMRNNTSKPQIKFTKPFQGPPLPSRGRSYDVRYRKKGSDMEPFYKFKNIEYYGQRDPITFGYDEVDDKYRYYSPYRNDYDGSRFGSYTYNYYLNAPMRGDISEDFKYPPQYYYKPKLEGPKPGKVFTNLI